MQFTSDISNQIDRYLTGKMPESEVARFEGQMGLDVQLAQEVELQRLGIRVVELEGRAELRALLSKAQMEADKPASTPARFRLWSLVATILLLMLVSLPLLREQMRQAPIKAIHLADVSVNGYLFAPGDPGGIPVAHIDYFPSEKRFFFVGHLRHRIFPISRANLGPLYLKMCDLALPQDQKIWLGSRDPFLGEASDDFIRRLGYKSPRQPGREGPNSGFDSFAFVTKSGSKAASIAPKADFQVPGTLSPDGDFSASFQPSYQLQKIFPNGKRGCSPMNAWLQQAGQMSFI